MVRSARNLRTRNYSYGVWASKLWHSLGILRIHTHKENTWPNEPKPARLIVSQCRFEAAIESDDLYCFS